MQNYVFLQDAVLAPDALFTKPAKSFIPTCRNWTEQKHISTKLATLILHLDQQQHQAWKETMARSTQSPNKLPSSDLKIKKELQKKPQLGKVETT